LPIIITGEQQLNFTEPQKVSVLVSDKKYSLPVELQDDTKLEII
jgi:hypothetical protein